MRAGRRVRTIFPPDPGSRARRDLGMESMREKRNQKSEGERKRGLVVESHISLLLCLFWEGEED